MAIRKAAQLRTYQADALGSNCNSGYIKIYTGSVPTDVDDAATGTLLGTLTLNADAFGAASDNGTSATVTANAITDDSSADNSGTAGYFVVLLSNGTTKLFDGTVTATGGGGDMELVTTSITAGQPISITSFTYSVT